MSGAGNIFTVLRAGEIESAYLPTYVPLLCDARATLGRTTEGLLVVGRKGDRLSVEFFNPDGSTGMMCGNGARCAVQFASDTGLVTTTGRIHLEIADTVYTALHHGQHITIDFPPPRIIQELALELEGMRLKCMYVDVGSDHVVFSHDAFLQAIRDRAITFEALAPLIRYHTMFPRGTNVNLYQVESTAVRLITYERGVEAVTGACGTGALATAVTLWQRREIMVPWVHILPPSCQLLKVTIVACGDQIERLSLSGPVQTLAVKTVELPELS